MKVLLTGASSFTGMWFARALSQADVQVTATLTRGSAAEYPEAQRRARIVEVERSANVAYGMRFGDDAFLELLREAGPFDALCHHGADVTDYKSPDFDVARAVANNTHNLRPVLRILADSGCKRLLLTGSVFEGGEGAGSQGLPHFSPYGLSKAVTAEAFRYYAAEAGISLGKFVIPNPFGPHEEPRFTAYLMRTWRAGEVPRVQTPAYVRDNIHVDLLARAYARFVRELPVGPGFCKLSPSGYVESQGAFAQRFAREVGSRLNLACPIEEALQTEYPEPRIRLGTDVPDAQVLGFDESRAWDAIAEFYAAQTG
ncbi:MAG: NAD(P)-dependent oxidoreductase [Myxococcales bacterium]|nr:NAD(P)-dependent oxidoreductase [Myxococcales bacterium]